ENTGQLQIHIETIEISGYSCEGYGFKVVNCQEFTLSANASRDIIIFALFLLVIGTAYLEAQGIWEPFRRRLSFEASNPPFDVGRPFDLRRIVGISSEGNLNTLSCDPGHSRGFCGAGGSSSRPSAGSHKQCGPSVHPHSSHS
ncbi:transmembrane protein 131, partial [Homo sapiens]